MIKEHEYPEKLLVVRKTFGINRAMDLVSYHLCNHLGIQNVALSNIIPETVIPGPDPLPATNSVALTDYASIMDKLIAFTHHEGKIYSDENAKVFQVLQNMVSQTSYKSSIKSYQQTREWRDAFLDLFQHYIGSSKWDKILEDTKAYVMKVEWNGCNHRFNFRSHIGKHY